MLSCPLSLSQTHLSLHRPNEQAKQGSVENQHSRILRTLRFTWGHGDTLDLEFMERHYPQGFLLYKLALASCLQKSLGDSVIINGHFPIVYLV